MSAQNSSLLTRSSSASPNTASHLTKVASMSVEDKATYAQRCGVKSGPKLPKLLRAKGSSRCKTNAMCLLRSELIC